MSSKLKVIIAEDHPVYRDGLFKLISTFDEIGHLALAVDGQDFLSKIISEEFDLALVDIKMPGIDGIEAIQEARISCQNMKIIVISAYESTEYVNRALAAGASAYLLKDSEIEDIRDAIGKVINGYNYFSPRILAELTRRFEDGLHRHTIETSIPNLTGREIEIINLICLGFSRQDIAQRLFISQRTVDKHKENILLKTNTTNAVSLALFAIKNRIVNLSL